MASISGREKSSSDSAIGESLSALVDNQGNELDLARVLKASEADGSVRMQWQRYHQISAVMRKEEADFACMDLSQQIRSALDLEPALNTAPPGGGENRKWLHLLGKTSIAATVAAGFLVVVQQLDPQNIPGQDAVMAEVEPIAAPDLNSAIVPAGFDTPQLSARTVSTGSSRTVASPQRSVQGVPASAEPVVGDPELKAHFDRLLMIHAQEVSANSNFSVMPFARLTDLHALDKTPSSSPETEPRVPQASQTELDND